MESEYGRNPERVLIVDDIEINVEILSSIIRSEGYEPVCALNVKEALDMMNHDMPQLILSDYSMPGMNGVEFCKLLKKNPKTRNIPFILITVANSSEVTRTAFEAGAVDYIPKPFERMEVVMRIKHQMENYRAKQEIVEHNRRMHKVIAEQKMLVEKEQENLLNALAKVVQGIDPEMGAYLERIGYNSRILAQSLQLTENYEQEVNDEFADTIYTAAKLHDIGALSLSDGMAQEGGVCGRSNDGEYEQCHTCKGAKLLRDIGTNSSSLFLKMAVAIAQYHHAHWDGTGYPSGVKEINIPLAARIVMLVCDFDGEQRKRAGEQTALEDAVKAVCERSGTIHDPEMIKVFAKIAKQLKLSS